MTLKYGIEIDKDAILNNIDRITNQIFKLLPTREEGDNWEAPLENLIIEIKGMDRLLLDQAVLFSLLCKMESLFTLTKEDDFFLFRKTIFECLGNCNALKKCLQSL